MARKFIKGAIKHPGALHKQLEIPQDETIPLEYLQEIRKTDIGAYASLGTRAVEVTRLLKKRAILALNLRRIKR